MIILEVGLEPHKVTEDGQRDSYITTEYFIKISEDGKIWYVNNKESLKLDDALKKRDELLDRITGRRG